MKIKKEEKMSIQVTNVDHLGLLAGIIDEISIEEKINQLLLIHSGVKSIYNLTPER
jgi:hypothetical protein